MSWKLTLRHWLSRFTPRSHTRRRKLCWHRPLPLRLVALEDRLTPADKFWVGDALGNGNWNIAANWSPGGIPAAGDDVFIDRDTPAPYTVTVNVDATVNSLAVNSGDATLRIL